MLEVDLIWRYVRQLIQHYSNGYIIIIVHALKTPFSSRQRNVVFSWSIKPAFYSTLRLFRLTFIQKDFRRVIKFRFALFIKYRKQMYSYFNNNKIELEKTHEMR